MSGGARRRILGAIVLALVLAAAWHLLPGVFPHGDGGGVAERPRPASVTGSTAGFPEADRSVPLVTAERVDPASDLIPPPVDLDSADLERDLHGVVVDERGSPVAGAALEVERTRPGRGWGDEPHLVPQPEPLRALSARDGTFRFRLEWGESVDLHVRAEGFGGGMLHDCLAGTRLRLVLTRGASAAEVLVRDGDGMPVPDAEVTIWGSAVRSGLQPICKGKTDGSGRLVAEGLAPGDVSVGARHPDRGERHGMDAFLPAGESVRVEVVLVSGRVVEGIVLEAATGLPVAGARVGRGNRLWRAVVSDAGGRFRYQDRNEVCGLNYGGLRCEAAGFARAEAEVPPEGPVEFRLVRGFRVEGRIVGADGEPVPGAEVTASGWQALVTIPTRVISDHRRVASTADGRFTLDGLLRDLPYDLSARAPGHGCPTLPVPAPPEGVDSVSVGDVLLPRARRVEGVVLDAEGSPIRHAEVYVGSATEVRLDDRGRFRVADASAGVQEVRVQRPDAYLLLETKVTVPEDGDLRDLVLRLPAFRSLRVRVTDPAGIPIRGAEVHAFGEEEVDWRSTDVEGWAVLDQIKDEVVDVSAELSGPADRPLRLRAYVEEVRPTGQEMTLVLEEGVLVKGHVLGPDGTPAAGVRVWATNESEEDDWTHDVTGESGAFEFLVRKGALFEVMSQRADGDGNVVERGTVPQVAGPRAGLVIRLEPVKSEASEDAR